MKGRAVSLKEMHCLLIYMEHSHNLYAGKVSHDDEDESDGEQLIIYLLFRFG